MTGSYLLLHNSYLTITVPKEKQKGRKGKAYLLQKVFSHRFAFSSPVGCRNNSRMEQPVSNNKKGNKAVTFSPLVSGDPIGHESDSQRKPEERLSSGFRAQ
ncbi:hypothetical protein M9H77_28116 [Catharanthus roseus]|uniref:Uncharacterized protein n=1 Tax=Catharanthus roseus TaxID=4058 RepID=A0ACC0AEG2_CATRO|nr:hypothetical protein M9H77_28116 [Catharanthus roseus]